MPDTYITVQTEKGSINISEDVITAIALSAVSEVDGIAGISGAAAGELKGKRAASKGIRVSFEGETVTVEASVLVRQGANITAVAEKSQSAVTAAVESTTGLRSIVNVRVTGVAFEK